MGATTWGVDGTGSLIAGTGIVAGVGRLAASWGDVIVQVAEETSGMVSRAEGSANGSTNPPSCCNSAVPLTCCCTPSTTWPIEV